MIVLRSPKGWTGPEEIKGHKVEGSWRSHQVPFADVRDNPANLALLERWMRSYQPEALFDAGRDARARAEGAGASRHEADEREPARQRRAAAQGPDAARLPRLRSRRAAARHVQHENTRPLGEYLRDVMARNMTSFRVFGPDETASNRLQAIYQATKKTWMADLLPEDADGGELAPDGRVMEMLSEHTLVGWLEGYLLTGRHGFFHTYEAFAHVIDSMFNQHAKWLDISKNHVPWRASVASQNILLSSTVWRQDHNGFSHQDPGFIDLVTNKSPSVTRVYLPPDANTPARGRRSLPAQPRLHQRHRRRQAEAPAVHHHRRGDRRTARRGSASGRGRAPTRAKSRTSCSPRCGDVADHGGAGRGGHPARARARAEAAIRQRGRPVQAAAADPSIRTARPSASSTALFTTDKPIIFNFHGYPWLIHKLAYRFKGHENLHVRGYKEKGNINTPLELAMLNETSTLPPRDRRDRARAGAPRQGGAPQGGDEERHRRATCATPTSTAPTGPRSRTGRGRSEAIDGDRRDPAPPRPAPAPRSAPPSQDGGVNFSVFSKHATRVDLLLFDDVDAAQPARILALEPSRHRTYTTGTPASRASSPGRSTRTARTVRPRPSAGSASTPTRCCSIRTGWPSRCPTATTARAASRPGDNTGLAMKSVVADPQRYDWEGDRPLRRPFARDRHLRDARRRLHAASQLGRPPQPARHLRRADREDPLPAGPGHHRRRAAPGVPVRSAGLPARTVNYWGYQPRVVLRAAPRLQLAPRARSACSTSSGTWSRRSTGPASR